jgi:hypothetical protein
MRPTTPLTPSDLTAAISGLELAFTVHLDGNMVDRPRVARFG